MNISTQAPHTAHMFARTVERLRSNDHIHQRLRNFIFTTLFENPYLLYIPYDGTKTLWKWLIERNFYVEVEYIATYASERLGTIRWFIPSNYIYDYNRTLFTDPTLSLSPKMYELLVTMTGERLTNINKKTKESVLHILTRADDGEEILKSVIVKYGYDVDPNLIDIYGKSALHYAIEEGKMNFAKILVEDLGADWQQLQQDENEWYGTNYSDFLDYCMVKYRIFPNFPPQKTLEETEECIICIENMPIGDRYFMHCCRKYVHSRCLSNNLARADTPNCMLCRADIRSDAYLYDKIPNTIYKKRWEAERLEQMSTDMLSPEEPPEDGIEGEFDEEEDDHVVTIRVPYEGSIVLNNDDGLYLPPTISLPPLPTNPEDRSRYFIETLNTLREIEQGFLEGRRHSMSAPNTSTATMVIMPSFRSVGTMTTLDDLDSPSSDISSPGSIGNINTLYEPRNPIVDNSTNVLDNERVSERAPLVEYIEVIVYDQAATAF